MFANDLSHFCTTITITTLTTIIITFSSFTYIKNLYTQIVNRVSYHDKAVQTDIIVMIHSETQTDSCDNVDVDVDVDCNSYITNLKVEDSLENLILLAKDQLVIQVNPSGYKWFFDE